MRWGEEIKGDVFITITRTWSSFCIYLCFSFICPIKWKLSVQANLKHGNNPLFSLFRSKRKVLGRKEPSDSFGSRQSLVSPVKHSTSGSDLRNLTLGSSQRSSSRNENFMALLQKKGSKSSSGGARVSAMELLKSTNPLARRVTEFSSTSSTAIEGGDTASGKPNDQWTGALLTDVNQVCQQSYQLILQCGTHCGGGPLTHTSNWIAPTTDWPFALSKLEHIFG